MRRTQEKYFSAASHGFFKVDASTAQHIQSLIEKDIQIKKDELKKYAEKLRAQEIQLQDQQRRMRIQEERNRNRDVFLIGASVILAEFSEFICGGACSLLINYLSGSEPITSDDIQTTKNTIKRLNVTISKLEAALIPFSCDAEILRTEYPAKQWGCPHY